jgi:hypothetical protein
MHGRRCCWAFACNPQLDLQKQCELGGFACNHSDLQSAPLQAASTSIVITIKMTLAKCPWVHVLQKQQYEETYRECRIAQMSEAEYGIWVEKKKRSPADWTTVQHCDASHRRQACG